MISRYHNGFTMWVTWGVRAMSQGGQEITIMFFLHEHSEQPGQMQSLTTISRLGREPNSFHPDFYA